MFETKEDVAEDQKEAAKGMALLFRSELKKTEDVRQDENITLEIQLYVQKLL